MGGLNSSFGDKLAIYKNRISIAPIKIRIKIMENHVVFMILDIEIAYNIVVGIMMMIIDIG